MHHDPQWRRSRCVCEGSVLKYGAGAGGSAGGGAAGQAQEWRQQGAKKGMKLVLLSHNTYIYIYIYISDDSGTYRHNT
jgi:hypothetical protein